MKQYYKENEFVLYEGNCLEVLKSLEENSVDLIFADPPYFLSNDGLTCKGGKIVPDNRGSWDKSYGVDNDYRFSLAWLSLCRKVLKNDGAIWISGTFHNIFKIGFALEKLQYCILNEITWFKPNASPNLSHRYFVHSHETLLWAKKNRFSKHQFNYTVMKNWNDIRDKINHSGKQMKSVWSILSTPKWEKLGSGHPTQKPVELLRRVLSATSDVGDLILDPFNGSGTTGIVSLMLGRRYIGIDENREFLEMTRERFKHMIEKEIIKLSPDVHKIKRDLQQHI